MTHVGKIITRDFMERLMRGETWPAQKVTDDILVDAPTCPACDGAMVVQRRPAGAGHADDLAEYDPCPMCWREMEQQAKREGRR
jgi:hypothetical protein